MGIPFIDFETKDRIAAINLKARMPEMAQYVIDVTPLGSIIPWSSVLKCIDTMYATNDAMEAEDARNLFMNLQKHNNVNRRHGYGDIHLAVARICQ